MGEYFLREEIKGKLIIPEFQGNIEYKKIFSEGEKMERYLHTGIRVKVIEEIKAFAVKYDIQKVILFGSRARGDYRERSDIDLAIKGGCR